MKVKEARELLKLFSEPKYNDYEIVFWDFARQKRMDGHFGGLSHPEKEISIPISVVGEKYTPRVEVNGLPEIIPSPFVEGKNAYLHHDEDAELAGIRYERYFYECEETGHQFATTLSDTFTMCSYYLGKSRALKKKLEERDKADSDEFWEKLNKRITDQ